MGCPGRVAPFFARLRLSNGHVLAWSPRLPARLRRICADGLPRSRRTVLSPGCACRTGTCLSGRLAYRLGFAGSAPIGRPGRVAPFFRQAAPDERARTLWSPRLTARLLAASAALGHPQQAAIAGGPGWAPPGSFGYPAGSAVGRVGAGEQAVQAQRLLRPRRDQPQGSRRPAGTPGARREPPTRLSPTARPPDHDQTDLAQHLRFGTEPADHQIDDQTGGPPPPFSGNPTFGGSYRPVLWDAGPAGHLRVGLGRAQGTGVAGKPPRPQPDPREGVGQRWIGQPDRLCRPGTGVRQGRAAPPPAWPAGR